MLVSRRLGKLESGAYGGRIPFMRTFLRQKASVGEIRRRLSLLLERSVGVWPS